jgi:hypothetical protein
MREPSAQAQVSSATIKVFIKKIIPNATPTLVKFTDSQPSIHTEATLMGLLKGMTANLSPVPASANNTGESSIDLLKVHSHSSYFV